MQVGWEVEGLCSTLTAHSCSPSSCKVITAVYYNCFWVFFLRIPLIPYSLPHIGQECEGEQKHGPRDGSSMSKRQQVGKPR